MLIRVGLALILTMLPAPTLAGSALPRGFVYLRDIDPTIVQDIRYAGSHNFVGRPIRGYLAAECILSEPAANALEAVQKKLAVKKLSLIVWDCYRPKRAVDDFLQWSKDPTHSEMKTIGSLAGEHGGPGYSTDRFFIRAAAESLAVP
jgi:D-alanyl-D-alanine dipeptidase